MIIKKNMIKRFIAVLILSCVTVSYTSMAEDIKNNAIFNNSVTNEIVPMRTNYLRDGSILISRSGGVANAKIKTIATIKVSYIYHDVTIFKNGVKYSSGRYNDWNKDTLESIIPVSAVSGDYIDIYADHYVQHNGITEVSHSHESMYY